MRNNYGRHAAVKLAFGAILRTAFSQVFSQFADFAKLAVLPIVLSLGISAVIFALTAADPKSETLLFKTTLLHTLGLLPFALFAVACSQRCLRGEQAGVAPGSHIGLRSFICFYYALVFLLLISIPSILGFSLLLLLAVFERPDFILALGIQTPLRLLMPWNLLTFSFSASDIMFQLRFFRFIGPFQVPTPFLGSFVHWYLLGLLIPIYVITRFSTAVPALSERFITGLAASWRRTRGNSLRLFFLLAVLGSLALIARVLFLYAATRIRGLILGAFDYKPSGFNDWPLLLSRFFIHVGEFALLYLIIAVFIAALCCVYTQLSEPEKREQVMLL